MLLTGCHHITLHILPASSTSRAPTLPIIFSAVVGTLTREEATLRQTGVTLGTLEAPYVKVFVLHPQYFPTALLLARLTKRFTFFQRFLLVLVGTVFLDPRPAFTRYQALARLRLHRACRLRCVTFRDTSRAGTRTSPSRLLSARCRDTDKIVPSRLQLDDRCAIRCRSRYDSKQPRFVSLVQWFDLSREIAQMDPASE